MPSFDGILKKTGRHGNVDQMAGTVPVLRMQDAGSKGKGR